MCWAMDDQGRQINARAFVQDFRLGATDAELMQKYRISPSGLSSAFRKLLKAGVLTREELEFRSVTFSDTVEFDGSDIEF